MATPAVHKTCQRCLSRCRRKPDHYREGGGCDFWFRPSKNKTYSCTKNYLSSSWRFWENTPKKYGFQQRKVMLCLCSCNSSSSVVPNVIHLKTYTCQKENKCWQYWWKKLAVDCWPQRPALITREMTHSWLCFSSNLPRKHRYAVATQ